MFSLNFRQQLSNLPISIFQEYNVVSDFDIVNVHFTVKHLNSDKTLTLTLNHYLSTSSLLSLMKHSVNYFDSLVTLNLIWLLLLLQREQDLATVLHVHYSTVYTLWAMGCVCIDEYVCV